jgi:hypothetical protein
MEREKVNDTSAELWGAITALEITVAGWYANVLEGRGLGVTDVNDYFAALKAGSAAAPGAANDRERRIFVARERSF